MQSSRGTPLCRPSVEALEDRRVPTAQLYFSGGVLYYVGDANANTLALSNTNGFEVASLTVTNPGNPATGQGGGTTTTTISSAGINGENVTESTGNDTITVTGRNLGVDQFFTGNYYLGSTAAHLSFDLQNGDFGCDKFTVYGYGGPSAISMAVTGMAQNSMLTALVYCGAGGGFSFAQSGETDYRGLQVQVVNVGDGTTTSVGAALTNYGALTVTVSDYNAHGGNATVNVSVAQGATGSVNAYEYGSKYGDDSLTLNVFDASGLALIDADIKTTIGNPNVRHTPNVGVQYY